MRRFFRILLAGSLCFSLVGSAGCESLQRKFTRKSKTQKERPDPVIRFQDYSKSMKPSERYDKHYLMFKYWSDDLLEALSASRLNFKEIRRASSGSLTEMRTLHESLPQGLVERFLPFLKEREDIDHVCQETVTPAQVDSLRRRIESQARAVHRDFAPDKVRDQLDASAAEEPAKEEPVPGEPAAQAP